MKKSFRISIPIAIFALSSFFLVSVENTKAMDKDKDTGSKRTVSQSPWMGDTPPGSYIPPCWGGPKQPDIVREVPLPTTTPSDKK